jgi:putative intracellular protease/amidase
MLKKLLKAYSLILILFGITGQVFAANILIVMSDENHLDLKGNDVYATGFYLNELMQPVKIFLDAGHKITFATPNGMAPTLDKVSDNVMFFGSQKLLDEHKNLLKKLKLTDRASSPVISLSRVKQIGHNYFDAIFVPGGHAPMSDLLKDKQLGELFIHFHKKKKPTALVCHGPIALLSTLSTANNFVSQLEAGEKSKPKSNWIYKGYKMTAFSNDEEEAGKGWLGGGEMKFYPQDALTYAGAIYKKNRKIWEPNVVVDRELITGQNPASASSVAMEILKRLNK